MTARIGLRIRTIYRGLKVRGKVGRRSRQRREWDTGYPLMKRYSLPPVNFTRDEPLADGGMRPRISRGERGSWTGPDKMVDGPGLARAPAKEG